MIKKILFLLLLTSAALTIDSCSSSSSSSRSTAYPYMIGKIEVIGNEPFTKLALRVDESHLFLLRAPRDLEIEIAQHQQGLVKLYYSGREEKAKDHYLDVANIEQIANTK